MTAQVPVARPCGVGRFDLGEGPFWDATAARLSWVDISRGELWWADLGPDGAPRHPTRAFGGPVATTLGVAVPGTGGGWTCGADGAVLLLDDEGSVLDRLGLEPETVRMNDGACDPAGRFWVGSKAHDNASGAGSLFRVDLDGTVTRVLRGLTIANGLGWSPDGTTMYVTDSAAGAVDAYAYDVDTGELGPSRPLLRLPAAEGAPDGLTVDADGYLWVAVWGGGAVRRYAPDGNLQSGLRVAASHVTSCTFVGSSLTDLVVTTARDELTAEQLAREPDAGRLHLLVSAGRGTAAVRSAVPPTLRTA